MKKLMYWCVSVILLWGCTRSNGTLPVTAVENAIIGKWQVDSTVTFNSEYVFQDSIYTNHFMTITANGSMVTMNMGGNDIMNYTINDTTITPYTGAGGCGMPLVPSYVSVSVNHLNIIASADNYLYQSALPVSTITYLHK